MNMKFIENCIRSSEFLEAYDFRPLASSLGCVISIEKNYRGTVVLHTDYGGFHVSKNSIFDLRRYGILTVKVSSEHGECELDVCDVRVMATLGRIGDAEDVFKQSLRFNRGDSTQLTELTDTDAFEFCRDHGYPGCVDRFEHFLRSAYWLDGQGEPVKDLFKFAEYDARLISLIPNTYKNGVGATPRGYAYDMQHFGVCLRSRYDAIQRAEQVMFALNNPPLPTQPN